MVYSDINNIVSSNNSNIGNLTSPPSEGLGEVLLSSAYFAPIQWYQKLNRYDSCLIEQHDNFVKQTYRNRCVIASANGPQTLSIPVEKFESLKCPMKDVRISDHDNWRHQHWNALLSSYGESPFFEYYAYLMDIPDGIVDFREVIRPKHPGVDTDFVPRRYYQVYQQKFGFLPNLSILDLLFNEGNESVLYL